MTADEKAKLPPKPVGRPARPQGKFKEGEGGTAKGIDVRKKKRGKQ